MCVLHSRESVERHLFRQFFRKKSNQFTRYNFWQASIIPVLGPRAFQHTTAHNKSTELNEITSACELFTSANDKLACFQLRSPLVNGEPLKTFFADLIEFLQYQQINDLVILTGSFAHEQHSIGQTKFMYLCDEQFRTQYQQQLQHNGWIEWERTNNVIHGGGFALKLYKQINGTLPSCILFKYISEGDNRCDAVDLVKQAGTLMGGLSPLCDQDAKIVVPISWKAMFGNDPTEALY